MWTFSTNNSKDIKSIFISILLLFFGIIMAIFFWSHWKLVIHESESYDKHRLVLIVLDALRHDYLEITAERNIQIPNMMKMAKKGSRVMKMTPVFPSMTMPNHQSIITGLYSPYHGITNNAFNDSSFNYEQFWIGNQSALNENRWYSGYPDPIWVTCEKVQNCKSGSMLWPNNDAKINGYSPSKKVDQYIALTMKPNIYPYDRRVDMMIDWIKRDLIDFGMLYFEEPDEVSHVFGPFHNNTLKKVVEMDGWIGRFIEGIRNAELSDKVDIVLIGDHGMTTLSKDRVINIDEFVSPDLYKSTYSYPVGIIYPNKGKEEEVFKLYQNASKYIKVFWRKDLPKYYNYNDNDRRISPIVTVVELGWVVNSSHNIAKLEGGNHGYYQNEDDMKATLLAIGPSFQNTVIQSAKHVDLYPLMAHLLGLKANPNNGSFSSLSRILKDSAKTFIPRENRWNYMKFNIFILFVIVVYLFCCSIYLFFLLYEIFCKKRSKFIEGKLSQS